MNEAAKYLHSEQDFQRISRGLVPGQQSMRHVSGCHVHRRGDFVIIAIAANAFLHHFMVRNIAGSLLLAVGTHSRSVDWFQAVLLSRDRTQAAETAPPEGLYLARVDYPEVFGLPDTPEGPTMLTGRL